MSVDISVIGLGYLGATQAIILAKLGHNVVGVDTDTAKVASLKSGNLPFYEPGLGELLAEMISSGRLAFFDYYPEKLVDMSVHFLCVGTPQKEDSNEVDVSAVIKSAEEIATRLSLGALVVGRSTVPIGTAEKVARVVAEVSGLGSKAKVAWNPEFLSEGTAIEDSLNPDRIVIGVQDIESEEILREVYQPIIDSGVTFLSMDIRTSELVKVAANSFLATKISFINGVASVAEKTGASTDLLAEALGLDSRIGSSFLRNGLGYGGGCLPKDIAGFQYQAEAVGAAEFASLLGSVRLVNAGRIDATVMMSIELLGDLKSRKIAVLGAAFKPNTDDLRGSPGILLAKELASRGVEVSIHDPVVKKLSEGSRIQLCTSINEAMTGADLIILATDWAEYKTLLPEEIGRLVRSKNIIDGRGALQGKVWTSAGWEFRSLGEGEKAS
jgi:UDPglucose 6-dehydrogenase